LVQCAQNEMEADDDKVSRRLLRASDTTERTSIPTTLMEKAVSSDINGAFNYQPNGLASISLAIFDGHLMCAALAAACTYRPIEFLHLCAARHWRCATLAMRNDRPPQRR
jgi:hypothetical protein